MSHHLKFIFFIVICAGLGCKTTKKYPDTPQQQKINDELVEAVKENDVSKVKKIIEQGANPNSFENNIKYRHDIYAIHYAISKKNLPILQLLIDAGANLKVRTKVATVIGLALPHFNNQNKINTEAIQQSLKLIEFLIKNGADPNEVSLDGYNTPLLQASKYSSVEIVKYLVQKGANVHYIRQSSFENALMLAAMEGNTAIVVYLKEQGAKPVDYWYHDKKDLFLAKYLDKLRNYNRSTEYQQITEVLFSLANLNAQSLSKGETILSHLIRNKEGYYRSFYEQYYDQLIQLGAKVDPGNLLGACSTEYDSTKCFYQALELGADVNYQDVLKRTALHKLGENFSYHTKPEGFYSRMNSLLNKNANVNLLDNENKNILMILSGKYRKDRSELSVKVLEKTQNLFQQDINGKTALHYATRGDDPLKYFELLLEKQPKLAQIKDNSGLTPLAYLVDNYKEKTIQNVIEKYNWPEPEKLLAYTLLNNTGKVTELINKKIDLNLKGVSNNTVLFYCTDPKIFADLIKAGVNIDAQNQAGDTIAHKLSGRNYAETMVLAKILLQAKPNLTLENRDKYTPISRARLINNKVFLSLVEQSGYDLDPLSLLIKAIASNDEADVSKAIKLGADVNYRVDSETQNPLQLAVRNKNIRIIELLLKAGADPNTQSSIDDSPLHFAAGEGLFNIVKLLVEHKANVNINNRGRTPLLYSIEGGHKKVAQYLINSGTDVLFSGKERDTILTNLLKQGWNDLARQIMDKSIEVINQRDSETALMVAVRKKNIDIVKLLLKKGADTNIIIGFNGETALFHAVRNNDVEMVILLLQYGADPNVENEKKQTIFDIARKAKFHEITRILNY